MICVVSIPIWFASGSHSFLFTYLPSVDGSMMPRYDPMLLGGEARLSCAKMNAIPSPEMVEFGNGEILTVKVVEMIAGQAITGWWKITLPMLSDVELPLSGSVVRLRYPLFAFTEPIQINFLFPQLLRLKEKEKFCG